MTELDLPSGHVTAAVAEVPGLPWRVMLTAPSATLYAPVAGHRWSSLLLWLAFAIAGASAAVLFTRLGRACAEAATASMTDPLTRLPNRRAMQAALVDAGALSVRHGTPFAALTIDIDWFKKINDAYGHDVGDAVICATAAALEQSIRNVDRAARWGGEEFMVLLHHTDGPAAVVVAERILRAIASVELPEACTGHGLTASIGVAALEGSDTNQLVTRADEALYSAKTKGRNRFEVFAKTEPTEAKEVALVL